MDALKGPSCRNARLDRRDPASTSSGFALTMNDTCRYLLESAADAAVEQSDADGFGGP